MFPLFNVILLSDPTIASIFESLCGTTFESKKEFSSDARVFYHFVQLVLSFFLHTVLDIERAKIAGVQCSG